MYERGKQRKKNLVDMLGGKCKMCNYDKCLNALDFHHRDPDTKTFGLTLNVLWSKPWDLLVNESMKCDVLCANCHREIHTKEKRDEAYRDIHGGG